MSLIDDELARAEANAADRRQQLAQTVVALQARLKPSALARDAVVEIKEVGGDIARAGIGTIKRNPGPSIGVVAVITALLVRKPITRLFHRKPE